MIYIRTVFAHLCKDLQLEWRNRDGISGMLFFSLLIVVVFALAFDPTAYPSIARQTSGGLLWVGVLFASITALNGSWARELSNGMMDAHRLALAPPSTLLIGKALANFLFVTGVEVVLSPVFLVFYNLHFAGQTWFLLAIFPLGTWALVCNGTFFAALSSKSRNRELLLPLILCPVAMPALLAVIQATTNVITGEFESYLWIQVLFTYDVVFTTAAVLLFGVILEAE